MDMNLESELQDLIEIIIPTDRLKHDELLDYAKKIYRIEENESFNAVKNKIDYISSKIYSLVYKFYEAGKLSDEENKEQSAKYRDDFERLFGANHMLGKYFLSTVRAINLLDSNYDYKSEMRVSELESMQTFDFAKMNNLQKLLIGLRYKSSERNLRKSGDKCMQLYKSEEGFNTMFWTEIESIEDFVYKNTNPDGDYVLWQCATNPPSNTSAVINRFIMSEEGFKEVKKDRHIFSFKNGIYETNWKNADGKTVGKWHPYEEEFNGILPGAIEDHRVSAKFFPQDFNDYSYKKDWYDIPTPHFQSILDYQEFPEEVCRWMYIFAIGRMLYDVAEMDEWQIAPFLKGKAKSGKSTIVTKVCKELYCPSDIGVLSNNIEKKFGLSALVNNFAIIAPEVKENLGIEQTEFQSMISGEDLQVAVKNKTAYPCKWNVPVIFACNKMPDFSNNSGSYTRRTLIFNFDKSVEHANTQLGKVLASEIPLLIQKGNMAYLEAVQKYEKRDLWDNILPKYFSNTNDATQAETNALVAFFCSSRIKFGSTEDYCISESVFLEVFNEFVRVNSFDKARWVKTYYEIQFERKGIQHVTEHPVDKTHGSYYTGIKLVEVDEIQDEDYDDIDG